MSDYDKLVLDLINVLDVFVWQIFFVGVFVGFALFMICDLLYLCYRFYKHLKCKKSN